MVGVRPCSRRRSCATAPVRGSRRIRAANVLQLDDAAAELDARRRSTKIARSASTRSSSRDGRRRRRPGAASRRPAAAAPVAMQVAAEVRARRAGRGVLDHRAVLREEEPHGRRPRAPQVRHRLVARLGVAVRASSSGTGRAARTWSARRDRDDELLDAGVRPTAARRRPRRRASPTIARELGARGVDRRASPAASRRAASSASPVARHRRRCRRSSRARRVAPRADDATRCRASDDRRTASRSPA